jgi:hypothetical protein
VAASYGGGLRSSVEDERSAHIKVIVANSDESENAEEDGEDENHGTHFEDLDRAIQRIISSTQQNSTDKYFVSSDVDEEHQDQSDEDANNEKSGAELFVISEEDSCSQALETVSAYNSRKNSCHVI